MIWLRCQTHGLLGEWRRELGLLGSRAADELTPLPEELAAHLTGH